MVIPRNRLVPKRCWIKGSEGQHTMSEDFFVGENFLGDELKAWNGNLALRPRNEHYCFGNATEEVD